MGYNKIFKSTTLNKLNKQSADNLRQMMGDRTLINAIQSSMKLLEVVNKIEQPYIPKLEDLAVKMVKDLYPLIEEQDIHIDAKIVTIGDVNKSLGEIKVLAPGLSDEEEKSLLKNRDHINENSPESKRRVINGITQGAALRGAYSYNLFREHLDGIDPTLVDKYNELMRDIFGVYDDDNAIAMFLNMIAQGQVVGGGSSKVILNEIKINTPIKENEPDPSIIIKARAICFPILVHEIIKGLYELASLHGFSDNAVQNQDTVDKVDKLANEPEDIKYGKFIYDALNSLYADSKYQDPRIREFFFIEVYKMEDKEFIDFIENAINGALTSSQKMWVDNTLKDISIDLKQDDYNNLGINEAYKPIYVKAILEYSQKLIDDTISRWKSQDPSIDDNIAKQMIKKFDQIKSGLSSKLDIIILPDELKQKNFYLNIDKYSFEDMVNLLRSLPEDPKKIKKGAIDKFKDEVGSQTAQSYVARFLANRDKLKYGIQSGIEELELSSDQIKKFIPKYLLRNDAFLDPRNWKWREFEEMLDAIFPSNKEVDPNDINNASTDADKLYDKDGIEIYKADDINKCISYNPVGDDKKQKYGWCVTKPGNTNYDSYRFGDKAPTFYFVFNRNKTSDRGDRNFEDEWHAFVVQVYSDGESYKITGANNRGDIPAKSWEDISKIVDNETWQKIKDLKDYFKPIKLSSIELARKFASGRSLNIEQFKDLSQNEKILYIIGKASKNNISKDILEILPKYKINYEGRSTTLANVAIDGGQTFPYALLKDSPALAKRYAVFRFRHTDYSKSPIPLPYIQFLDEDAKLKYYETFQDNLTFEYIDRYFGENLTKKYVQDQTKKLDYLPKEAIKYISDPKIKKLYEVYSILFDNWKFSKQTNISDEELEQQSFMPEQIVDPRPLSWDQWKSLEPSQRNVIFDLAQKFNENTDYIVISYAVPFVIKSSEDSKTYILLPDANESEINNGFFENWVLVDKDNPNKIVKKYNGFDTYIGDNMLLGGYPSSNDNYKRVWSLKDIKIQKN